MPFIGALLGAIMTGLMWWVLFGNGKEVIEHWLDSRNEEARRKASGEEAMRGRENERRAALRTLQDPREAAIAVMVAVAEARGLARPEIQPRKVGDQRGDRQQP